MKKLILSLIIGIAALCSYGQIVQSSCTAADSVVEKYIDDADRLALMRIFRNGLSFADSVNIPIPYSDTVRNALLAVYNAFSLPARDTVIEIFNIHAFPNIPLRRFSIFADSNLLWMQNIRNNIAPTGDPFVDSLIDKYSLTKKAYYPFGLQGSHIVDFEASNNLNMKALSEIWKTIPGVENSVPDYLLGSGNTIYDSIYSDHVELIFDHAWACNYSTCLRHHFWKFNIYFDCTVEFMGSYGDQIPVLGTSNEIKKPITVSPNPFNDNIQINGLSEPFTYLIVDTLGKLRISGSSDNGELKNLNSLEKGIYMLSINLPKGKINFKIIKE